MKSRAKQKRKWLVAAAVAVVVVAAGLAIFAAWMAARVEPYAREATIQYLERRFDCDVQLQALRIRLPKTSLFRLLMTRGRGIMARVEGQELSMRLKNRAGAEPMFAIKKFQCDVDLESLIQPPAKVAQVTVDGMEIQLPPRRDLEAAAQQGGGAVSKPVPPVAGAMIARVTIRNAALVLQPRDPRKIPLRFEIQSLQLDSTAPGSPMRYTAALTNAKPPGRIHAAGLFGPWRAAEPGETPITGDYHFEKADLGVFSGIAGTLDSSGRFEGQLAALTVHGQATVPDFRLRSAGNPVPLATSFTVLVDATNGNTELKPVTATLGSTRFTTTGGIIKHEAGQPRAISLMVDMPDGDLGDVLRLAMKGEPFMEGRLALHTRIDIPPLSGKVRDKLILDGRFAVTQGRFLHSTVQEKIDALSQRAQGQPAAAGSDQAVSRMDGVFHLQNATIHFSKLSYGVPGADVDLAGDYGLENETLGFGGTLKLQAKVSELVTGWKRALLKPIDGFFQKEGAGTFLRIRVNGTSKEPRLGVLFGGAEIETTLPKH